LSLSSTPGAQIDSSGSNQHTQSENTARSPAHSLTLPASISIFTFAVCYFRSFIFPAVPLLPGGDAIGFANAATRILAGQLPYRDYLQVVPPGTDLTYALLLREFGLHTWVPNIVMATLAAIVALLITLISMRVMQDISAALPGLFLVGFLLPESLDGTHHWFSTVTALLALLVLLGGDTFPRVAAAGALCGVTACFTQTKGAAILAAFIVYLIWKANRGSDPSREWVRQCLLLGSAAAGVFAVVNAYFVWAVGLRQWWYCIVIFPLRYYPAPVINNWRILAYDFGWRTGLGKWIAYPFVYATVPFACIVFLMSTRRRWKDKTEPWPELVLIALMGLFMFLAIAQSPSLKRLGSVGPPAMVLLAWMLGHPGRVTRLIRAGLIIAALMMALITPVRTQLRWHASLDLPGGRTAFEDKMQSQEYSWALEHTRPGQFFFGMSMYLPFHLRNPGPVDGLDASEYTRPEQVAALVQGLEAHQVPLMILPSEEKYPLASGLPSNHLAPFRDYLCQNYQRTSIFANGDEVWQRRDESVSIDRCALDAIVR
jgi:hypothetical protein